MEVVHTLISEELLVVAHAAELTVTVLVLTWNTHLNMEVVQTLK
jgi:hypothetical protein